MDKSSKIVVTGAKGLVGSALVEYLSEQGFENVFGMGREDCDLLKPNDVIECFSDLKPDLVFHAAAKVYGIMGNINNKALSIYDNIMINTNVIHASHLCGVKKLTAMGTGAVYPYPSPGLPLKEDMIFMGEPHYAEDSYAHAKRAMLAMLKAYEESHGLNWAYIVSCNLFGPHDKFDPINGHVVPSLICKFHKAKIENGNVNVWGDGSAQRDFMYVKDAARVAVDIMDKIQGPVNIGSGRVFRIKDIVNALGEITGLSNRIKWDSSKPNGQDYRAYDLTKINEIGFKTAYETYDALKETWEWYCDHASEVRE